jgi:riboflavin biosynthesis pyrimidine reductase
MLFERAIPPGPATPPEAVYTGLDLGQNALRDRPYLVSNFVSSADGKGAVQGRTALLGGDGDRATFHLLRSQVDAILAGTGTLGVERYGRLVRDDRIARIRVAEGRPRQPLAVVITRSGRLPLDIPLFGDDESRIVIYAPSGTAAPAVAAQVTLHEFPHDGDQLAAALRSLRHDHDVRSLLCEGGPALFNGLLEDDLVDELFLTLAPGLVGGHAPGITTGAELDTPRPLRLIWALARDNHLFLRYARER